MYAPAVPTIVATLVLLLLKLTGSVEVAVAVNVISAAPKVWVIVKGVNVIVCDRGAAFTHVTGNVYVAAFIAKLCDKPITLMKINK